MIRKIKVTDYPRLMEIWESAVLSTHDFLKEEDFLYYKERLPVYFQYVNKYRGAGIGKKLITYAIDNLQVTKVDVNEQNVQAVGFYEYMGFNIYKRSNLDGEGKEYPILHMQL